MKTKIESYNYLPLHEVMISFRKKGLAIIECPWLQVEIQYHFKDESKLKLASSALAKPQFSAQELQVLHWLFNQMSHLPMVYLSPVEATQDIQAQPHILSSTHLGEVTRHLPAACGDEVELALTVAKIKNTDFFDPKTLLSYLRLQKYRNQPTLGVNWKLIRCLQKILADNENLFLKKAAILIQQNLYVTKNCIKAMNPVLNLDHAPTPKLWDFIQAEIGHDLLLENCLSLLGYRNNRGLYLADETLQLIEILSFSARHSLFGFSILVDFFESDSADGVNPLALLLEKTTKGQGAAKYLHIHRRINSNGNHHNVALGFLEDVNAVDELEARIGIILAFAAISLKNQLAEKMIEICAL